MPDILEIVKKNFTNVDFDINLILHSLILFTFLSLFFTLFITKITKSAFNHEISNLVDDSLGSKIEKIKENKVIKTIISKLPLNNLIKAYDSEDTSSVMHNNGLFVTLLVSNLFLWAGLIIVILIIKYHCNTEIKLKEIIIENAVIFTCIGIVEYMFFTNIAVKFVPVEPSFISKQFLDAVKNKLN
jgi:hypothetical protein